MYSERNLRAINRENKKQINLLKNEINCLQNELEFYKDRHVNQWIDSGKTIYWISEGEVYLTIICFLCLIFGAFMFPLTK
jgi:phage host-nuclease inhibitor protein Gam